MATLENAREAKAVLRHEIGGRDGVTGIGITRARPPQENTGGGAVPTAATGAAATGDRSAEAEDWVLRVNVASADVVGPASVDGVDVEVRVVGTITRATSGDLPSATMGS